MPSVLFAEKPEQIPAAAVDGKITTVYWNICGLGQPIRYALELAGVDYVDVRVHWGPGEPGTDGYKKLYFDRKAALDAALNFPNLPYFFDGDIALTQSNTILRYIGRKFNLMGEPAKSHIVDLIFDQMSDFDAQSTGLSYREGLPGLKAYCENALPGILSQWTKLLGDKPFMTGDSVTVADLKVYETLRKLQLIESQPEVGTNALSSCAPLMGFIERVEALPALQAYKASDRYMDRPLNNEHAKFK
eukprot:TRINITY_DN84422_c0_g1_i1.p1 TRINITY_DN84422_c0_g1~~TRINITY_DN84422_c0_g1_i1.p1  ORF type:complete len:246 (-),score=27.64 TRINITY_DN84422_c0_g1_i1:206-943(-)